MDKIQRALYTNRQLKFRKMDLEPTQFSAFPPSEEELKLVLFYPQDQNPADEPVLMYVTENPATGEAFMDFFMETSNTYYQFPIFQMPHDDRIQLTPTSCQFASYKVHRTQGTCLLFQTLTEPKLTVVDLYKFFTELASPTIEMQVDVSCVDSFLFEFCGDLPCYFNNFSNTVIVVSPSKNGSKETELCLCQCIALGGESDGVSVYSNDDQCYINVSLLQPSVKNTIECQSTENSAKLYQAYQFYQDAAKDSSMITQSDQKLKEIGDANLQQALKDLIQAARDAYSFDLAVVILKACSYCKLFLKPIEQSEITQLYDTARNQLRLRHDLAMSPEQGGVYLTGH